MKKTFSIMMMAAAISFCACGSKDASSKSDTSKDKTEEKADEKLSVAPVKNAIPLQISLGYTDSERNDNLVEFVNAPYEVTYEIEKVYKNPEKTSWVNHANFSIIATIRLVKDAKEIYDYSDVESNWNSYRITFVDKDGMTVGKPVPELTLEDENGKRQLLELIANGKAGDTIKARYSGHWDYGFSDEEFEAAVKQIKGFQITGGKYDLRLEDGQKKAMQPEEAPVEEMPEADEE